MKDKHMTISEFARITEIKRANLIFYDNIGLLVPEYRGENGYRYYSRSQLGSAFLIGSLREIGIGIEEIKAYAETRTPEKMLELFKVKEKEIQKEIEKLVRIKEMMNLYSGMTKEILKTDISEIQVVKKEEEHIFLGPWVGNREINDELSIEFYDYAAKHGMELSYPFGAIIEKENLLNYRSEHAEHFYLKSPTLSTGIKPAGYYLVGFSHGDYEDYGKSDDLQARMLKVIEEKNLKVIGNAYEEWPLNEISIRDSEEYLMKLEILIELR